MDVEVESAVRGGRERAVAALVAIVTVAGLLGVGAGVAAIGTAVVSTQGAGVPVVSAGPQDLPEAASAVVHGVGLPGVAPVTLQRDGALTLGVYEGVSTPARILATADVWAGAIAAGLAALVLVPVLRSTASRDPFAARNPRRLALAAGVAGLGWLAASTLPVVAASLVVASLRPEAGAWVPVFRPEYWPLGFVALLAALAYATWQGSRLVADTEGLV